MPLRLKLLFCLLAGCYLLEAQPLRLPFHHLTQEEGLSDTWNSFIHKDSRGFVWISSLEGLHRFDGSQVKVYRSNQSDSTSIAGNIVTSTFYEDALGNLWFTTYGAVNCYLRATDQFRSYTITDPNGKPYTADYYGFYLDGQKRFWVRVGLGAKGQLFVLNTLTSISKLIGPLDGQRVAVRSWGAQQVQLLSYYLSAGLVSTVVEKDQIIARDTLVDQMVSSIFMESDTSWWLGTTNGMLHYQSLTQRVEASTLFRGEALGTGHGIVPYGDHQLLVGFGETRGRKGGLYLFDKPKKAFVQQFAADKENAFALSRDFVNGLYLDDTGVLWVTIWNVGVDFASIYKNKFDIRLDGLVDTTARADVKGIVEANSGDIWCGTRTNGLFIYNQKGQLKTRLWNGAGFTPSRKRADFMLADRMGGVWIGARTSFYKYDRVADQPNLTIELPQRIRAARQLKDGNILLGLNKGAFLLRKQASSYSLELLAGIGEAANLTITQVFEDQNGRIYLAANADQLFCFERNGLQCQRLQQQKGMGYIWDFWENTTENTIWMATSAGLAILETDSGNIAFLNEKEHGIQNENFYHIMPDEGGNFWLSTNNGLVKYTATEKMTRRYTQVDGVQDYKFYPYSALASSTGNFWFGGARGVNIFNPKALDEVTTQAQAQLTQLLVNDEPIEMDTAVGEVHALRFPYDQNTLAFRFAALEYSAPSTTSLEYRMINQDPNNQWVKASGRGQARYANLGSGQYTFEVRAANSDGLVNEKATQLAITIDKPFWETWWFRSLIVLAILGFLLFIGRFILKRRLAEAEALRLKELDEFKNRLYQNITHEFKTPLTVIMGMTDQIMGNEKARTLIHRNSKNMLSLITQILDLSRVESGRVEMNWVQLDVVAFLHYLTESFQALADQKQVRLTAFAERESLWMDTDRDKLQQIISNLLSNALKFTKLGGKIVLHAQVSEEATPSHLQVTVKDTGIGIPAQQLPHIFDRFYQQADDQAKKDRKVKGSGVGLTLTKELVELLGGTISAESTEGKGSTFTIQLPIHTNAPRASLGLEQSEPTAALAAPSTPLKPIDIDAPLALLVDDNPDIISYIESCISDTYRIESASNGQEGIDKALALIPDIIISDLMMPVKDGFELCDTLKRDQRTSHIPIILLTARANVADRVNGLQKGADAYLTKPFNKAELLVRLEKLIELRRQLQARFGGMTKAIVKKHLSPEELFLNALHEVVQARLDDPDLGVNDLSKKVHLSHTQMYRKLKALTGKTPSQFMRTIRLQKGLELLQTTSEPISAIAYDVGFSDPNYFSRMFQELYGQTPSSVRE